MWLVVQLRDQWLSLLVMRNYWLRSLGLLPDEWYWADRDLMDRGRHWMPCYWTMCRFRGLISQFRFWFRMCFFRVKLKLRPFLWW